MSEESNHDDIARIREYLKNKHPFFEPDFENEWVHIHQQENFLYIELFGTKEIWEGFQEPYDREFSEDFSIPIPDIFWDMPPSFQFQFIDLYIMKSEMERDIRESKDMIHRLQGRNSYLLTEIKKLQDEVLENTHKVSNCTQTITNSTTQLGAINDAIRTYF